MRRFEINYNSMEGNWLIYIGFGIWGISLVYLLFFISRWPYPVFPYLAVIVSFMMSLAFILFAQKHEDSEVHVRVTAFAIGITMYLFWYILFVRSTIYGSKGIVLHGSLMVLFIASVAIMFYSFAVEDKPLLKMRR